MSVDFGRFRSSVAALAVTGLLASGCGDSGTAEQIDPPVGPNTDAITTVSADIKGSGASFPDAFYQEAVEGLGTVAPELRVTYEAVGSAAGREGFSQGLSDFAGTDSLLGPDEHLREGTFFYIPATAASVAVAFNVAGVDELHLDPVTLAEIFQRDITRWDDPAIAALNPDADLPAIPITVARRSDGAGTTKNFTTYLDRAAPGVWRLGAGDTVEWPPGTEGGQQNPGVAQIVVDAPGGIGYVDYGNAVELELQMAAIRNRSGEFVAPSIEATAAALEGSELADDLTFDPLDGPGAGAYPITAPTYLLVRRTYDDRRTGEGVVAFVHWLVTDGADNYAADLGYAPIPGRFRDAAEDRLDQVEVG